MTTSAPARTRRPRRLADALVTRRRRALVGALALVALLAAARVTLGGTLSAGGFDAPGSEALQAAAVLEDEFGVAPAGFVAVVTAPEGATSDDPGVAAAAAELVERLEGDADVASVTSYWSTGAPTLRSEDGRHGLVLATIAGTDEERPAVAGALAEELRTDGAEGADGTDAAAPAVAVTGLDVVGDETSHRIEADLLRAELIAFPIVVALLYAFLRRLALALVPIAVGLLTVVGGIMLIGLVSGVTTVTVFATNLVVGLGLGLAIDYALLIVARYQDELAAGATREAALRRSVRIAGRTVAFSAGTVAIALAGLAVFPMPFLRSMAYAGIGASVLAAALAVTVTPALLAALGDRVPPARTAPGGDGHGAWYRLAVAVMRRPLLVGGVVVAGLLLALSPVLGLQLGQADDRNLPEGSESRAGAQLVRDAFDGQESSPVEVVLRGAGGDGAAAAVSAYAAELSQVAGVARVDAPDGSWVAGEPAAPAPRAAPPRVAGDTVRLTAVPAVDPGTEAGVELVRDVRDVEPPFEALVGGSTATRVDNDDALIDRIPLALGIIALVTFVALFLMFGSLLVPLKALVLNTLSLSATFGAMVWVFQDGNLSGLLGFTATGSIASGIPMLVFCVAFGLSMDYEVFLLARIKERYDQTGDPVGSVAVAIDRTGRIVTFLALLVAVVFAGFATSGVTAIQMLGVGLTVAVLLDAYVIRGTLVPAFMRLAGHANWWAPAPLRRFHARFGFSEHAPEPGP